MSVNTSIVDAWPWPAGTPPELLAKWKTFVNYESNFPDFPSNFTPPWLLDPSYVAPARGTAVLVVCILTLIVSGAVTVARLVAQWQPSKGRRIGWKLDDALMAISFVFVLFFSIVQILIVRIGGVGRHIYDNQFAETARAQQMQFANLILYVCSAVLLKNSILFFIRRLTSDNSVNLRRVVDGTIIFNSLSFVIAIFLSFFQCKPPSASWNLAVRYAHFQCLDMSKVITAISVIFSAMDLFILILPMNIVWAVKVKNRERMGILIFFALGGFAAAASITKIVYLNGVYDTWDPTWNGIYVVIWNQLELTIGMMTASLPGLSRLLEILLSLQSKSGKTQVRFRETVDEERPSQPRNPSAAMPWASPDFPRGAGMAQAQITTKITSGDPTDNPYWNPSDSSLTDLPKYLGDEILSEKSPEMLRSPDVLSDITSDAGSFRLVIQHPERSFSDSETVSTGPPHPYYSNKKDLYHRL